MDKKSINFFKTSNSAIEINEMQCPYCDGTFYEMEGRQIDECPLCDADFDEEPNHNATDSESYTLIVDHKTGIPSIIRNDEYEPILKSN